LAAGEPLHAILARIRLAASRTGELSWLYSRVLLPAEEAAARLWGEFHGHPRWEPLLARLAARAAGLLERVRGDPYGAYDDVKRLAEEIVAVHAAATAGASARQALAAGAGAVSALLALLAPGGGGAVALAAGIAAAALGIAAVLLSKYRPGAPLAVAAALSALLAMIGGAPGLYHAIAVAAALSALAGSLMEVSPPPRLGEEGGPPA